jgi:hypothetical protein
VSGGTGLPDAWYTNSAVLYAQSTTVAVVAVIAVTFGLSVYVPVATIPE